MSTGRLAWCEAWLLLLSHFLRCGLGCTTQFVLFEIGLLIVSVLAGIVVSSIILLLLLAGYLCRLVLNLNGRVITLTHDFTVNELPQDDLPISTGRQYPLYMITFRSEHLRREIKSEQRVNHICVVSQHGDYDLCIDVVDLYVWLLLQWSNSNRQMSLRKLNEACRLYFGSKSLENLKIVADTTWEGLSLRCY